APAPAGCFLGPSKRERVERLERHSRAFAAATQFWLAQAGPSPRGSSQRRCRAAASPDSPAPRAAWFCRCPMAPSITSNGPAGSELKRLRAHTRRRAHEAGKQAALKHHQEGGERDADDRHHKTHAVMNQVAPGQSHCFTSSLRLRITTVSRALE